MATATPVYGTNTALTITLNSLGTDTTGLVGRQSATVNNVTGDVIDYLVGGKFTLSASALTAGQIEIWAFASYDAGTTFSGSSASNTFGTADAARSTTTGSKTTMRLLTIIPTATTINEVHVWGPFSMAAAYGGSCPTHWGIWITQKTGQALAAAGNEVKYSPFGYESA